MTDSDWRERIAAAAEGRDPEISRRDIPPYHIDLHSREEYDLPPVVEVRPRAGTWSPVAAAIPLEEWEDTEEFNVITGPSGRLPQTAMTQHLREGDDEDQGWHFSVIGDQATPTQSVYVWMNPLPSRLLVGEDGGMQVDIDVEEMLSQMQ